MCFSFQCSDGAHIVVNVFLGISWFGYCCEWTLVVAGILEMLLTFLYTVGPLYQDSTTCRSETVFFTCCWPFALQEAHCMHRPLPLYVRDLSTCGFWGRGGWDGGNGTNPL